MLRTIYLAVLLLVLASLTLSSPVPEEEGVLEGHEGGPAPNDLEADASGWGYSRPWHYGGYGWKGYGGGYGGYGYKGGWGGGGWYGRGWGGRGWGGGWWG